LETYMGNRGTAPHILNFGTNWSVVFCFTPRSLNARGTSPWFRMNSLLSVRGPAQGLNAWWTGSVTVWAIWVPPCYMPNFIILSHQYRFPLTATIPTRMSAGHSAAVAYTAKEPTGSDKRYWPVILQPNLYLRYEILWHCHEVRVHGFENKQLLYSYTALDDWYLQPRRSVYCAVRTGCL
jgi:hypothetical protein